MLDPMMAKDIDETMKAYEMKKKPILEVSFLKLMKIIPWKCLIQIEDARR